MHMVVDTCTERRLMRKRQDSEQPRGSEELAQGCETRLDYRLAEEIFYDRKGLV